MKKHLFSCVAIAIFCFIANASAQTTHYVKTIAAGDASGSSWNNASGDLQLMINSSVPGDVVWVAGGTYKPIYRADHLSVLTPNDRNNAFVLKPDVKIYGGFAGNETALTQRDSTRTTNNTILSGDLGVSNDNSDNAYHVVISAGSVGSAELNGFTIKDGNANGSGGNITVLSKFIYSNEGGGLELTNSSPVLTNITVSANNAIITGGGINNYNSSPVLSFVKIIGNIAGIGGGIYNNESSPVISNTIISGNSTIDASGAGGGIYNLSNSSPVLTNVIISGNTAGFGGGIINNGGSSLFFTNATISGNFATHLGGGILNGSSSSLNIRNTIIYGNSTGIYNNGGSAPTITYSLVQDLTDESNGNISGNKDPLFVAPLSPGLSTGGHYRLKNSASPAYNSGNNNYFNAGQTPDLSAITTDIDGEARIQDGNIDLGAYEGVPAITPTNGIVYVTVNGAGSLSGSSWANASNDLQQAINGTNVQQVWVAAGTYKPINPADNLSVVDSANRTDAYVLKKDVKIYGGFAGNETALNQRDTTRTINNTILSGDIGQSQTISDNAYHVVISAGDVGSAELNGFSIIDGTANGDGSLIVVSAININNVNGGGIAIYSSSPSLSNLTISGSNAVYGGGIYDNSSSLTLTNVTISGNSATTSGGGICNIISSPFLTNVNISDNNASVSGGGVFNQNSTPVSTDVIISGNSALNGAGIYNGTSSPILTNIVISGNNADNGSAIYNTTSSSPVLTNVTVSGNNSNNDDGVIYNISGSSPLIRNSIIYGNSTGILNDGGSMPAITYSLVQDLTDESNGNISGNKDPLFVAPLSPGLSTGGNYRLKGNASPAYNKGNNNYFNAGQTPDLSAITTDLDGGARIQDGIIDLGAYEVRVSPNVSAGTVTAGTTPQCIGSTTTYTVSGAILGGGTGAWSSDNAAVATVDASTGVVTAVGAGKTNIVYTITEGGNAIATASQPYTVTPNASAGTVTAGTSPQCIGSTTTYSVSNAVLGGGTGAWSSDNTAVATVDQFTGIVTAIGGGTCNIIYTVTGGCNGTPTASQPYSVISGIDASASSNPVALGSNATLSATISPAISGVTVSFNVDPGTGVITTYSAVTNNLGVATTSPISGLSVNLYKVVATAASGCTTSNAAYLPVYDPNSSFITGGGWIFSPAGALVGKPSLSGKANFGFVAKYKKGSNQVDGNTEFQFQDGDFNFKSSALDAATLVISGSKGTYRGEGTVNGAGDYGFMVSAVDGQINGGGGTDLFRIKIWDRSQGNTVVYDNNMGKDENGVPTTILGGGSIVIHYAKGKNSRIMNTGTNVEIANSNSNELTGTGKLTVNPMPNPTSYYFTLILKSLSKEKIMLTVTDIAGRVIEQRTDIPANSTIQLGDHYHPGIYIAEFLQGNDKVTTRLIKERK